jgi:flagellar biosynthesis protein FliR
VSHPLSRRVGRIGQDRRPVEIALPAASTIETFFLVAVRTGTLLLAVPLLGMRLIPPIAKIALGLVIALLLTPLLAPVGVVPARPFSQFVLGIAQEVLTGLLLAFAVALIFAAVQFGAAMLGLQFGFSLGNVIDPTSGGQETVIGQFYALLLGIVFFAINGHHLMLAGLARSFDATPPASLLLSTATSGPLIEALLVRSAALFVSALRIAMPIMGALLLADVAMAVIARSAPQMNVYFVGLPLKILIGLAGLLLALPLTISVMEQLVAAVIRDMRSLVG